MNKRRMRGQGTLEYVILTGFVVAALIAMGIYMKRGFQGKLRESTDQIGGQYSAQHTKSDYNTVVTLDQDEHVSSGGIVHTDINTNTQEKTGSETVDTLDVEK